MPREVVPPSVPGYTLLAKLGEGSYGSVWAARDAQGHRAALKVIDLAGGRASQLELNALETMKQLRHRHLVSIYTSLTLGSWRVIVMELAEGTLAQRLRHCREKEGLPGIPPDELLHYLAQAADALDYLHGLHFIHRDVKPDNLLLFHDTEPYIKLGDCGLLRKQRGDDEIATVVGTPGYMSPEVWQRQAGPAADRYNLAVTYVELRQGYRPFSGSNLASVARAHQEREPDLAGLQEQEQEVVRRALAKDPQQRYGSCEEFVQELQRALGQPPRSFRGRRVALLADVPVPLASPVEPPLIDSVGPPERDWPPPSAIKENGTNRPGPSTPPAESGDIPTEPVLHTSLPPWEPPHAGRGHFAPAPLAPPRREASAAWITYALVGLLGLGAVALVVRPLLIGVDLPRPPVPQLPAGFRAAEGSELVRIAGRDYPSSLVSEKLGDAARFWLLPPRAGVKEDPAAFYLQENKVTNRHYRQFAAEKPGEAGAAWQKGGRRAGADAGNGDDLPALRMTRPEAEAFARWLGGRLPSCAELDRAAAWRPDRRPDDGPFCPGAVAVGRRDRGPAAVGGPEDGADVCAETKVRGLAGNGAEWTGDDVGALAALRGRSYTAAGPLTYRLLGEFRDAQRRVTPTQRPGVASPYTGFRVAVELPAGER